MFKRHKLNVTKWRYTIQENEITTIVHCITTTHYDIQDVIENVMQHDPEAKKLIELVSQGKCNDPLSCFEHWRYFDSYHKILNINFELFDNE